MPGIRIKRAYEPPSASDGRRILVDRIWPRGLTKAAAVFDEWDKNLAPSTALRKWFGHAPERWDEFRARYRSELKDQAARLDALRAMAKTQTVTLVFSAKDAEHNQAVALQELLEEKPKRKS